MSRRGRASPAQQFAPLRRRVVALGRGVLGHGDRERNEGGPIALWGAAPLDLLSADAGSERLIDELGRIECGDLY
jgi:hypothetical protein